ncbi:MAG: hypothetical protein HY923_08000 [Elusimicrobia bacterium]|nr:hypothetical protein [Elusimicrobiota bacterium]
MNHSYLVLGLSIAALPILVNGQPQTLTTVNHSSNKSDLKDSVKDQAVKFKNLIDAVIKNGSIGRFKKNIAHVVGLPGESISKDIEVPVPSKPGVEETRGCYVIYENERPICAYIARVIRTGRESKSQYYRVALDGQLEKAVVLQGKRDESGKVVKGSSAKFEQDINSPEVKQAFDDENEYWLKDWLRKGSKVTPKSAKKSAAVAL